MNEDPGKWKVERLKRELALRGAKVSGRKHELVERLLSYQRNDNFQGEVIAVPDADPMPEFPPTTSFTTLTSSDRSNVPQITEGHVEQYVETYLVKSITKDTLAIHKGQKIMEECVMAASFIVRGDTFFLTGIVHAEMSKNLTYNMKLVIKTEGGQIIIKNSQCECPVGAGPTAACKHIIGTLLVLANFVKTGTLKIQLSCTEQLQTFKRPSRIHDGAPVPAENLGKRHKGIDADYDPRPPQFRNQKNYTDHVRNRIINFCANSNLDLTMRYALPRASVAGVVHDHHYVGPLNHA